ncbi:MAG: PhoH family protein [Motiliproteus sp.]|nr:PhoH family protein [Motiliproteus sp.]MCW9054131.1 PhoH family protein [Motiliproteus sp.]
MANQQLSRAERRQMKQSRRKEKKQQSRMHPENETNQPLWANFRRGRCSQPFQPLNRTQRQFAALIESKKVAIATGAAGTGKSYVGLAMACEALEAGEIERIIVVRPLIDSEEGRIGILPGELNDKIGPYFQPARDILEERMGSGQVKGLIESKRIEFSPLAFMRGTTFNDCWIIMDEGQNASAGQMKMLLTRLGRNSKLIINGDTRQCDLPVGGESGLADVVKRFRNSPSVGVQNFVQADIVRDDFVKEVVLAYEGNDGSVEPIRQPPKLQLTPVSGVIDRKVH